MQYYGLRVYDIGESIVASGLPMKKREYTPEEFDDESYMVYSYLEIFGIDRVIEKAMKPKEERANYSDYWKIVCNHIRRALNLGGAAQGSGHDSWLKGILVNVNIKADQSWWLQFERYHHQDTISLI